MVSSAARSVDEYLAQLPGERREVAVALRKLVRDHLPPGYVEAMNWGMPCYEVPLARHPDTYNGQPLGYVAFAAQKNGYSLYLMGVHGDPAREARLRGGTISHRGQSRPSGALRCAIGQKRRPERPATATSNRRSAAPRLRLTHGSRRWRSTDARESVAGAFSPMR